MTVRRIVPNIHSEFFAESRAFYGDFLGLDLQMDLGWIMTLGAPGGAPAQVTLIREEPSGIYPHITVEVDDVDALHARAAARDIDVIYGPADEPWGVRRFFAVDPHGWVINIMSHRANPGG